MDAPALGYFDGKWLPADQIMFPASDMGLQRGFGLFETLRAHREKLFHPERHLERVRDTAATIGLDLPWPDGELLALWTEAVGRNNFADTNIKVLITGGSSHFLQAEEYPRLTILASQFHGHPRHLYEDGASLRTTHLERVLPQAKSLSYLPSVMAWRRAAAAGDHEALFIHNATIHECATANFFLVDEGSLLTAADGVLAGTTRALVFELARQQNIPLRIERVSTDRLPAAQEAFITSVNRKIMPVVRIDDRVVGSGEVGPITKQLIQAFADYEADYFGESV